MSRSLNKVQIIGNLGKDPDIRSGQNGQLIANFSVATSDSWTDKQGQKQERTEWHSVSLFGKLAEIAQQYLRKGSKVYIEGQLKTDKYTDKQGIERYSTKIVVPPFGGRVIMLDGTQSGRSDGARHHDTPPEAAPAGGYGARYDMSRQSIPPEADTLPDFDDDIPF